MIRRTIKHGRNRRPAAAVVRGRGKGGVTVNTQAAPADATPKIYLNPTDHTKTVVRFDVVMVQKGVPQWSANTTPLTANPTQVIPATPTEFTVKWDTALTVGRLVTIRKSDASFKTGQGGFIRAGV